MGLDMYAYVANRQGQQNEFYDGAEWDESRKEFHNATVARPREIAYWRKHPNLHGWMEQLWQVKGRPGVDYSERDPAFNGIELELDWQDLDDLEHAVKNSLLPSTSGFFFGNSADDYYRERDLEFIQKARAELFVGLRVFYNSSW